jgi:release factor glutamine methyltransferase
LTIKQIYVFVKEELKNSSIENIDFEARILVEWGACLKPNELSFQLDKECDESRVEKIKSALKKRKRNFPLQYIIGEWGFHSYIFKVGQGVLIPRSDTEVLCEVAIYKFKGERDTKILDLCSGSGCIAITLQRELNVDVTAVELSDLALGYLKQNVLLNEAKVRIIKDDVLNPKFLGDEKFDLITCNPPYLTKDDMENLQEEVKNEPAMSLYGDVDGLIFYKNIPLIYKNHLKKGGMICFEIGQGQENSVKKFLEENEYNNICFYKDLCGIIRVITAIKN